MLQVCKNLRARIVGSPRFHCVPPAQIASKYADLRISLTAPSTLARRLRKAVRLTPLRSYRHSGLRYIRLVCSIKHGGYYAHLDYHTAFSKIPENHDSHALDHARGRRNRRGRQLYARLGRGSRAAQRPARPASCVRARGARHGDIEDGILFLRSPPSAARSTRVLEIHRRHKSPRALSPDVHSTDHRLGTVERAWPNRRILRPGLAYVNE